MIRMLNHSLLRTFMIAIIAAVLGAGWGYLEVRAEVNSFLSVPNAGNVGNAGTIKSSTGGGGYINTKGLASSGISLWYQQAHTKFWHHPYTPILQSEKVKNWYNSTGGWTSEAGSNGYGDISTTRTFFHATSASSSTATYYTSWPDNSGSCYTHWDSGNSC